MPPTRTMELGNSDGPRRKNWPVDIAGGVGAGIGIASAQWLGPLTGLGGIWLWMIAVAVGVVVGRLIGLLVFGRT